MKEPKVLVTMQDIQRYRILKDVIEKKLKATQASLILGLSYIHTLRLKQKLARAGLKGLLRPGRQAPNKIPAEKIKLIASLYKK